MCGEGWIVEKKSKGNLIWILYSQIARDRPIEEQEQERANHLKCYCCGNVMEKVSPIERSPALVDWQMGSRLRSIVTTVFYSKAKAWNKAILGLFIA